MPRKQRQSGRPPGRPRMTEQSISTYDLILKNATNLFLRYSYPLVSIDDIANECNVTKATVYYYFSSKSELFTDVMIQMMKRINDRIQTILNEKISFRERLFKVTVAHLKATFHIDIDSFMQGTGDTLSSQQIKDIQEAEENMYKGIEHAFQHAMTNNEIPEIHTTFAVHAYMSLLKVGNYRDMHHQPIFPTEEETAQYIIDFFWSGLFQSP